MTPERKAWWDSLPTEEKRVRRSIAKQRATIQFAKAVMNDGFLFDTEEYMDDIREAKHAIKALRKQIAQRPVVRIQPPTASPYKCPRCGASLMYLLRCVKCGQKLRWK